MCDVGRSLVEGCSGKVTLEMFDMSEVDIVLYKNTHTALLHPIDIEVMEQWEEKPSEKEKSSVRKVTKREPTPEELHGVCKNTQYDLSKEEKKQLSGYCIGIKRFLNLKGNL